MKTKNSGTAVPSAQMTQRLPHKNVVTKITHGQGDWPLMKLTEGKTPEKALKIVEELILKNVLYNQWRNIVQEYSRLHHSHTDLFGMWVCSTDEVFGLGTYTSIQTVHKASSLLDLIDQMIASIRGIENYPFDATTIKSMSRVLLECIVSISPSAEAMELWYRFLALGDKRDKFIGPIFHPDALSSQFEQVFNQYMNFERAAWLIEITATRRGVNPKFSKLEESAIGRLWLCLTTGTGRVNQQVEWARIIRNMIWIQGQNGNPDAVEACIRTVNGICEFVRALTKLRPEIVELKLPIVDRQLVIKADYKNQVVLEVTVQLNGDHADSCTKNLAEQRELANKYADQITIVVSEWASKNAIKNTFDLKVLGTLIESGSKQSFPSPNEEFRSVASIHTANS
ncbi:MAG: hypothetical protein WCW03_03620 [Candidatus Paceibacterota bacterium]|jgi:hypothetical protein